MVSRSKPLVFDNCISVKTAAEYSGYSPQYLRQLLRKDQLEGDKIRQVWLIRKASIDKYLINPKMGNDHRFGPKSTK
jgi:excisionase family DNA binding protein